MQINYFSETSSVPFDYNSVSFRNMSERIFLLFLKELIHVLREFINEAEAYNPSTDWTASFGKTESVVDYAPILARHQEIVEIRESYRPFINSLQLTESFYNDLAALSLDTLENGTYQIHSLFAVGEGISGTYFLADEQENPRFVIKPFDEEAGCINNPKFFAGVTDVNPVRDFIPLYRSAMRETLAYQVALKIGVESIAPKTVLAIIQAEQFHDYSDGIEENALESYLVKCGPPDRMKLCSVQEYVPNSKALYEAVSDLEMDGLTDQEIGERFDQSDFEDANILIWTTYDTDGHMGNLLAYPKGVDEFGHEILGIKKIDNGLAFPEKNRQLRNNLVYLDNANRPLSESAKSKIAKIDFDDLAEQFQMYGLESAIPALRKRIFYLKKISQKPGITIKEMNKAMSKVGAKE